MLDMEFGDIIRIRREELDINQDDLCEGLCDRRTLSRIEHNKTIPSSAICQALLQRLGLYYGGFSNNFIAQELLYNELKNKMSTEIRLKNYDILLELIEEAEEKLGTTNTLFYQFILRNRATYLLRTNQDGARELLLEAIELTHKGFSFDKLDRLFLTREEIHIMNMLANTYCEENDHETAVKIFRKLIEKLERNSINTDYEEAARLLILLKYNLSRSLGILDYYKECLDITEDALVLCKKHGRPAQFAELMINKAYALCSIRQKEEGALALKNALYINSMLELSDNVAAICRDAEKLFGIDLC